MASADRNFSGALSTWKTIDLSSLQKTLDAQGLELLDNQKESLVGRKALAERTKEFKKLPEEEKGDAFKTLLKSYQSEIDNLTKRSKASENAFLSVYKLLADAPDPYPLLEAAVDQTVKVAEAESLEVELQKLRDENAELRRRGAEVSNLETAVRKAESRADILGEKMENLIQERVTQKENELNAIYDEKLLNYEDREKDLQKQLSLTKDQLRDLRTSNDSTQAKLMNQSDKQDQEVMARLAEMEMVAADLERANARVAAVERRNELLRAEIETVRSGSESEHRIQSLETTIFDLEVESARLLRAVEVQKEATSTAEHVFKRHQEDSAKELSRRADELETSQARLQQYSNYDEIKRELEIMKYVEFAGAGIDEDDAMGADGDVQMPDPNAQKANQQPTRSLEALVHSKNKRLLEELTKLRIVHAETANSLEATNEALSRCRADLDKQRSLNERLETDLLQLNPQSTTATSGTSTPDGGLSGLNLGNASKNVAASAPIPFTSTNDTSILPIVTNQRDRFRQRNAELEEELRKQFEIISGLRADIKSLQQDNLKLYEKVRYMQSYRDESSTSGAGPSTASSIPFIPGPQNGIPSTRPDEINKYKSMYEERMNPFEAFRGREQARAVQSLNPLERGVFILTRQILGNPRARIAFVVYAGALHLLVFFTLYESMSFGTSGGTSKIPSPI